MTDEWQEKFDAAAELYTKALYYGATITPAERLEAAKAFVEWIPVFRDGGKAALEVIEETLKRGDAYKTNAAAKLLIEVGSHERIQRFSDEVAEGSYPSVSITFRPHLWRLAPPKSAEKWFLVEALFAKPTPQAYALFHKIMQSGSSKYDTRGMADHFGSSAVREVARWKDKELLRSVLNNPPLNPSDTGIWDNDPALDAAFHLGLMGETDGIAFLKEMANGQPAIRAAEACQRLAWLAQPSAIRHIQRLLEHDDGDVVWRALDAATTLNCGAFLPAFLKLAYRKIYADLLTVPLCDEALRRISLLLEPTWSAGLSEDYEPEVVETYTETYRHQAVAHYQAAVNTLKVTLRYEQGEPITLKHLANNLLSPHGGPITNAAYNLRAITGEDYGFDADFDNPILNLDAILKWLERAEDPQPLAPGGWASQGKPLQFPDM